MSVVSPTALPSPLEYEGVVALAAKPTPGIPDSVSSHRIGLPGIVGRPSYVYDKFYPKFRLRRGVKLPKSVALFPSDPGTFCGIYAALWSTLIVTPDFSSDLERAPGARSIAEEKSGVTILVIELHWSQGSEHFRSPAVFWGILPPRELTLHSATTAARAPYPRDI